MINFKYMKYFIFIIGIFLISCASNREYSSNNRSKNNSSPEELYPVKMEPTQLKMKLDSMLSKDELYLRENWGPPDKILDNAQLGNVFVYEEPDLTISSSELGMYYNVFNSIYYASTPNVTATIERYIRFWINPSKEIVKWEAKGFILDEDVNKEKREEAIKKEKKGNKALGIIILVGVLIVFALGYT